jgi:hypothetical protein
LGDHRGETLIGEKIRTQRAIDTSRRDADMQTKAILSTASLARRLDVDDRTVLRLVAKGVFSADYRAAGNRLLFFANRAKEIKAAVRAHRHR